MTGHPGHVTGGTQDEGGVCADFSVPSCRWDGNYYVKTSAMHCNNNASRH